MSFIFYTCKHASVLLNAIFKPWLPFSLTLVLLNLLTVGICLVHGFQFILFQSFYVSVFSNFRWLDFFSELIGRHLFWLRSIESTPLWLWLWLTDLFLPSYITAFIFSAFVSLSNSTLSCRMYSNATCICYTGVLFTMCTSNQRELPSPAGELFSTLPPSSFLCFICLPRTPLV